jgi:hypothetical protein
MSWRYREVTLTEMLSDPIVRSLMKADRVDPGRLEAKLRHLAAQRDRPPFSPRQPAACCNWGDANSV